MRTVTVLVFVALVASGTRGARQRPAGARDMFYDPASGQVFELSAAQSAPLRQVKPADGALQYVGIQYWFEGTDRRPVTAFQAASLGGTFTLHIRSNVRGFVSIWSVGGQRLQLTPEELTEWFGNNRIIPERNYAVTGDFQFSPSAHPTSLFVMFSQSETEAARSAADAGFKLDGIVTRFGSNGPPELVHETESGLAGQVGTYIVNQRGGVVAAEIIVSPTLAQTPPDDFAVRFEWGTCTSDVFDTFKKVFVRDMGPKPSVLVEISPAPDVLKAIYDAVVDAHFFEYPEEFNPRTEIRVIPAAHYRLLVRSGGVSHQVHWVDDARASTDEAARLRTLIRRITRYAFELPDVVKLPRAQVECL